MPFDALEAVTAVDGRYRGKTQSLSPYFSEFALIRYRVKIEIEYFIALCELPLPELKSFNRKYFRQLRMIEKDFSLSDATRVKEIEQTTNHDVKAVEYFIKEHFDALGLSEYKEFIHFGLTSQDINNTAVPLSIYDAMYEVYMPVFQDLIGILFELGEQWAQVPMLARTHGQPASPTRVGKEVEVFSERLRKQFSQIQLIPFSAKFGGAVGNFNAHKLAYPNVDWVQFANSFVNHVLNLDRSQTTTQIEHYDNMAALFDSMKRINVILLDMARDFWQYISMDYFKQKIKAGEVGSSAMPHKVNPIDFENAEGNLGMANAILSHLSAKLPVSRLQRDLTDSTVTRNIGSAFAHTLIAFLSLQRGLRKLEINPQKIEADLEDNWAVTAEAIQTILRRERYPQPYEALKALTRTGTKITRDSMHKFIDSLNISDNLKSELKQISPQNYTGI